MDKKPYCPLSYHSCMKTISLFKPALIVATLFFSLTIFTACSGTKVKAEGKFKRPMFYQLKKDEGIKALLKYSGGLEREALSSGVKI